MNKNGLLAYTAGPIDLGQDIPDWRSKLINKLKAHDIDVVMFDPSTSYKMTRLGTEADRRDAYIEAINKEALDLADVMVVVIPNGVQTVGTIIEVDIAYKAGKKILLLTDIPRGRSVYLNNRVDSDTWIYTASLKDPTNVDLVIEQAAKMLTKMVGGTNVR